MGVIPMLLGAVSKPLQTMYKISRLALRLKSTRKVIGVADNLVTFALDVRGKAKLSLTILLFKLIHGKYRCHQLAAQTGLWLKEHLPNSAKGDSSEAIYGDLTDFFSDKNEPIFAATPHLTLAGLLFLRDCCRPLQEADNDVAQRFKGPGGQLDVRGALTAFYGTATAIRIADALAVPNAGSDSKVAESLLFRAYDDLRYALHRDLTELLIL